MNKTPLKPGDLAADPVLGVGLVMRNDPDSGLLVAYPGHDELIAAREAELEWQGSLSQRTDLFTERELRLLIALLRESDLRTLLSEFESALDLRIKERLRQ
jgi:hypothetical protein